MLVFVPVSVKVLVVNYECIPWHLLLFYRISGFEFQEKTKANRVVTVTQGYLLLQNMV